MSELTDIRSDRATIRWKLLTSASALALTAYVSSVGLTWAEDDTKPTLWIEFGGQAEHVVGGNTGLSPPFAQAVAANGFTSLLVTQKPSPFAFGAEGKIEFQPEGNDWDFVAAIRYGRVGGNRNIHQQTNKSVYNWLYKLKPFFPSVDIPRYTPGTQHKFSDTVARNKQSYFILDFQAGKDVGLGRLGGDGSSAIHAGIRVAQFSAHSSVELKADPDLYDRSFKYARHHHNYAATGFNDRSFRGIGPSLSWNASAALIGNKETETLNVDWGLNAAVLFGKQRARGAHKTSGAYYHSPPINVFHTTVTRYTKPTVGHDRKRSIVVPNAGAFAGLSVNFPNAKVSIGYRGDVFFGAIDDGIDAHKSVTRGFYGPFTSVNIGLGD